MGIDEWFRKKLGLPQLLSGYIISVKNFTKLLNVSVCVWARIILNYILNFSYLIILILSWLGAYTYYIHSLCMVFPRVKPLLESMLLDLLSEERVLQ